MSHFSINLGDTVPYVVEKFLSWIGKDAATQDFRKWFEELQKTGLEESAYVQIIGMHHPVPIEDMYQPTRLVWMSHQLRLQIEGREATVTLPDDAVPVDFFLKLPTNAVIFAGPGWGKTTLVRFAFVKYARDPAASRIPVLFSLRRINAVTDLERFTDLLHQIKKRLKGETTILLLVDGYDEVTPNERKRVSNALLRFAAARHGHFILTCRDLYDVYDIAAPYLHIAPFGEEDQKRYVAAFSEAYGTRLEPETLLSELSRRGFKAFLSHPLLLALTCIIRTGPMSIYSRNVIALISRAIDTLTFRWDEGKGIVRETKLPLDGRDRIHCLMRIAFKADRPRVNELEAFATTREQLDLLRWEHLDPQEVLVETARFYGIFVPTTGLDWEFVHKTLYDYLGAKFWVEVGKFDPTAIHHWNAKAAYAACLTADATESMRSALKDEESLPAFAEMLSNDAPFDHAAIGEALIEHYETNPRKHFYERPKNENRISVQLSQDFISIASTNFFDTHSSCVLLTEKQSNGFARGLRSRRAENTWTATPKRRLLRVDSRVQDGEFHFQRQPGWRLDSHSVAHARSIAIDGDVGGFPLGALAGGPGKPWVPQTSGSFARLGRCF